MALATAIRSGRTPAGAGPADRAACAVRWARATARARRHLVGRGPGRGALRRAARRAEAAPSLRTATELPHPACHDYTGCVKPTTAEWLQIAADDLDAAQAMLDSGRYLYAAFEAQQCAEKTLKAVIQEGARVPPGIHDLEALAAQAALPDADLIKRLHALSGCYVATRYPEDRRRLAQRTDQTAAGSLVDTAREVLAWARRHPTSTPS